MKRFNKQCLYSRMLCDKSFMSLGARCALPARHRLVCVKHSTKKHTLKCKTAAVEAALTDDVTIAQFPALSPGAFTQDRASFHEEVRIRGYEVLPNQRANIVTVANLLQEVASNHAVGMWGRTDTGFANLPDMKDVIFVMTRMQIRMDEYPRWGDMLNIETYFTEEGKLAARREWVVTNSKTGQQIGSATSTWVTINIATRRLAKLPDALRSRFMKFTPGEPRFVIPVEQTKRKLPDFPAAAESGPAILQGTQQLARRSDMDMNGHINNVTYLAWALESVPQQVIDEYSLFEFEIDYKAECRAGDLIDSWCVEQQPDATMQGVDLQYLHTLRRTRPNGDKTELVRCRTSWKKSTISSNSNK